MASLLYVTLAQCSCKDVFSVSFHYSMDLGSCSRHKIFSVVILPNVSWVLNVCCKNLLSIGKRCYKRPSPSTDLGEYEFTVVVCLWGSPVKLPECHEVYEWFPSSLVSSTALNMAKSSHTCSWGPCAEGACLPLVLAAAASMVPWQWVFTEDAEMEFGVARPSLLHLGEIKCPGRRKEKYKWRQHSCK